MGVRSVVLVRVRRLVVVCVALVLGSGLLAACTDDGDRPGTVPSDSTTLSASPSTPVTSSASGTVEDQIVGVYQRFWVFLYGDAYKLLPDELLEALKTVTVPPQLDAAYQGVVALKSQGNVPFGDVKFDDIQVSGILETSASVQECRDETGLGTKVEATGQVTSQGLPGVLYVTSMVLDSDKKWKLATIDRTPGGC